MAARPLQRPGPRADVLRAAVERQHARRLAVYEAWAEAQLEIGDPGPVADTVDEMVGRHPLRERLRAAQLTALHQVGRRTEALAAYDDCRQRLSRELGLEPGAALHGAYRSLLDDMAPPRPRGGPTGSRLLLPPDLADFTGHTGELESVRARLETEGGPPVLVTGAVGVGKSAFAVHVAHRLAAHYPDGVVATRLCAEDGSTRPWASVLAELARSLGCTERLPADREEAATVWRSWLSGRRILLLLDDAPDATALGPLLPPSGSSAALVTSRGRLPCLECAHRVELPPLSPRKHRTCSEESSGGPGWPPSARRQNVSSRPRGSSRSLCERPETACPCCATCRSASTRTASSILWRRWTNSRPAASGSAPVSPGPGPGCPLPPVTPSTRWPHCRTSPSPSLRRPRSGQGRPGRAALPGGTDRHRRPATAAPARGDRAHGRGPGDGALRTALADPAVRARAGSRVGGAVLGRVRGPVVRITRRRDAGPARTGRQGAASRRHLIRTTGPRPSPRCAGSGIRRPTTVATAVLGRPECRGE